MQQTTKNHQILFAFRLAADQQSYFKGFAAGGCLKT
jgi:hypothetical protein